MDNKNSLFEVDSLSDKVYKYLRDEIMSGKIAPNTRLLENDLAASMQVSRAPVREALNMLVNSGFVVRIPRHGAVVAPVTRKEIDENWELRILIEPYAAKSACGLIPKEELLSIEQYIMDTMAAGDFNKYMDSDYRTHSIIYQYVPNSQLQKFLDQTMLSSLRYRYYTENNNPTSADIIVAVCHEHLTVVNALLEGNPDKAFEAMLSHTELSYQRIAAQLADSDFN